MVTRRRKKSRPGQPEYEAPLETSSDVFVEDGNLKVEASGDNGVQDNPLRMYVNDLTVSDKKVQSVQPGVAWGNIIRDSLKIKDPAGLAKRLREELELNDHTSYGEIINSLNKAAKNYDEAGRLHRAAKIEEVQFELVVKERLEVMRSQAVSELMTEYKAKARRSPTNDDIEDRMIQQWPDEYKDLKTRQAELHGAVKSLEILVRAWQSRGADLRVMAERATRVNV